MVNVIVIGLEFRLDFVMTCVGTKFRRTVFPVSGTVLINVDDSLVSEHCRSTPGLARGEHVTSNLYRELPGLTSFITMNEDDNDYYASVPS